MRGDDLTASMKGICRWFRQPDVLIILALIILAGFARLWGLGSRPLFNDELSAIFRLQNIESFSQLIHDGVIPDFHPAGVQVFLFYWIRLAGDSHFMIRLPFALAGVVSVVLCYLLAKRRTGQTAAWFTAAALALLQFPVMYSQLARPYSTGLMWVLAAVMFRDALLEATPGDLPRKRIWAAAGMAVTFAMAMYNHYFSFVMVALIGVSGLFRVKRQTLVAYVLAGTGAVILFLPHLSVSIEQVSRGGLSSWLPKPGFSWFEEHLLHLFNHEPWLVYLCLLSLVLLFRRKPAEANPQHRWLLALWYLGPLSFAFVYSRLVNPILQHSIMLFAFPFLLMLIFAGFRAMSSWPVKILAACFPLLLGAHLVLGARYYDEVPYANFHEVSELLCDATHSYPQLKWATDVNNPWYIHHYLDRSCKPDSALFYLFDGHASLPDLHHSLAASQVDAFAYFWLRPADPMVVSAIRYHFPYLRVWKPNHPYGEFFLFSKKGKNSSGVLMPDTLQLSNKNELHRSISISPEQEFVSLYEGPLPKGLKAGRETLIHAELLTDTTLSTLDMTLVITTSGGDGSNKSWHGINLGHAANGLGVCFYTIALPAGCQQGDILNVYLWNPGKEALQTSGHRVVLVHQEQFQDQ